MSFAQISKSTRRRLGTIVIFLAVILAMLVFSDCQLQANVVGMPGLEQASDDFTGPHRVITSPLASDDFTGPHRAITSPLASDDFTGPHRAITSPMA